MMEYIQAKAYLYKKKKAKERKLRLFSVIHHLFHIHNWKPKLSRYISFNTRDILYECRCGKRKIETVYRDFDTPFPIETTMMLTHKEMQDALLNGV